jgi:sulfur transfer protein SufE
MGWLDLLSKAKRVTELLGVERKLKDSGLADQASMVLDKAGPLVNNFREFDESNAEYRLLLDSGLEPEVAKVVCMMTQQMHVASDEQLMMLYCALNDPRFLLALFAEGPPVKGVRVLLERAVQQRFTRLPTLLERDQQYRKFFEEMGVPVPASWSSVIAEEERRIADATKPFDFSFNQESAKKTGDSPPGQGKSRNARKRRNKRQRDRQRQYG